LQEKPPDLEYEPRSRTRARKFLRAAIVPVIVVGAYFAWRNTPLLLARARLLDLQSQCTRFSEPAGTVAYEEQPVELESRAAPTSSSSSDLILYRTAPHVLVGCTPPQMVRLIPGTAGSLTLFLHARRAGGPRRLVVVTVLGRTIDPQVFHAPGGSLCVASVYSLASMRRDLAQVSSRHFALYPLPLTPLGKLRFYAGQPDPADQSHFTIDFETHERRGTLDGWLMSDDTVKLQIRK
jgi:hypothetical protein